MKNTINTIKKGFERINVHQKYKDAAIQNIEKWLQNDAYVAYQTQINYMAETGHFDELLDSFYQVLPFGTGGRRGKVGIGPNRINPWTIQTSAQGHSDYLKETFKDPSIVISYDVRKYPNTGPFDYTGNNPIKDLTARELGEYAAGVYAANGVTVYFFDDVRSTPELSFGVRYYEASAGAMMSASHNPSDDNGKKVYSSDGGQLIPPEDQKLVDRVNKVETVHAISFQEGVEKGDINVIGKECDDAYINALQNLQLNPNVPKDDLSIVYSPLHGVGTSSVFKVLTSAGYNVTLDEKTATPDGAFPNIKFNIPNPESAASFETLIELGVKINADLLVNTDPDADRMGIQAKTPAGEYYYFSGNEIATILSRYILESHEKLTPEHVIIKTSVTTDIMEKIAAHFNVKIISDLPVGFKYISAEILKLEQSKSESHFLLGAEESFGYLTGTYTRDKDGASAVILLCELAAKLKTEKRTLVEYLRETYAQFGYHGNKQSNLIFLGVEGKEKIDAITDSFRSAPPKQFGDYEVTEYVDLWKKSEIVSETDKSSRNIQTFFLSPPEGVDLIKVTVRPSGTEPKLKIYTEIGTQPSDDLENQRTKVETLTQDVLRTITSYAYDIVGVSMPDRSFLLSPFLPVDLKQEYFTFEEYLLELPSLIASNDTTIEQAQSEVATKLKMFGADPVEKISDAFESKKGIPLRKYLNSHNLL